MSVLNGEVFLAEAVESILGQTLRDFEFVIIDDGSTDRTADILSDYATRDGRVRVFRHPNEGRAESLNWGTRLATGRYIARMDADDVALPHRLKDQAELMDARPELGLVGGALEFISRDRRRLATVRPPVEDSILRADMRHCNPFYHPTVMMRKEVAVAAGGYRRALCDADDYDLFLRIAERSQMASLAHPILLYRIHSSQASVTKMAHQALCILAGRAAASLRRRGRPDPLWDVEEVTPELVQKLGVSADEIRREAVKEHVFWMPLLADADPDSALQLIERLMDLCRSGSPERSTASRAWLTAASIHYKQGRLTRAVASAGRGVLAQPVEAARVVKMAIARRKDQFKTRESSHIRETAQ
jgi:hypothetical protein